MPPSPPLPSGRTYCKRQSTGSLPRRCNRLPQPRSHRNSPHHSRPHPLRKRPHASPRPPLPFHRRPQELRPNQRSRLNGILIMPHDQFQIMSVPSRHPMIGQLPSLASRHFRSSRWHPRVWRHHDSVAKLRLKVSATVPHAKNQHISGGWGRHSRTRRLGGAASLRTSACGS